MLLALKYISKTNINSTPDLDKIYHRSYIYRTVERVAQNDTGAHLCNVLSTVDITLQ